MTQYPGYNLYAIHKSEISNALMSTEHLNLLWKPNDPSGWYICRKDDKPGVVLLAGPFDSERTALCNAEAMTDTSGT